MLELNKVYEWDDISAQMPDMWAFITDIKKTKDGMIDTCMLLDICNADEKAKIIPKYRNYGKQIQVRRTTDNTPTLGFLAW